MPIRINKQSKWVQWIKSSVVYSRKYSWNFYMEKFFVGFNNYIQIKILLIWSCKATLNTVWCTNSLTEHHYDNMLSILSSETLPMLFVQKKTLSLGKVSQCFTRHDQRGRRLLNSIQSLIIALGEILGGKDPQYNILNRDRVVEMTAN